MSEEINEHFLDFKNVARKYNTHISPENFAQSQGLSDEQVLKNRARFGGNLMPETKKPSLFKTYLIHLNNLFSIMLILSGFMSLCLFIVFPEEFNHLYVGITLILVAFFNAFLEFYQKYKSEELLKGFMKLIPDTAFVIRNGKIKNITALDIVSGDLLFLRIGDKIAADGRIIEAVDLKVDNSILTGESEPVERESEAQPAGMNVFEAKNLIFNGTTVASGKGLAIAVRTGPATAIGKLSLLTEGPQVTESQLSQEMDVAVRSLVTAGLLTGTTLMIISFSQGFGLAVSFEVAIGSFLAFLPQGLPATITILLTVAAKRLAGKNVLVKNLQGVETLGAITLLATDKTGTLTMNRMEVVSFWDGIEENIKDIGEGKMRLEMIQVLKNCNNVKILDGGNGQLLGDATEQGIYRMLKAMNESDLNMERAFEIPFSSLTKWHLVIVKAREVNEERFVYMKGAPEKVFTFCTSNLSHENENNFLDFKKKFEKIYEKFGRKGLRVIACAGRKLLENENLENENLGNGQKFVINNLTFYGLVGLQDPPKFGILESVKSLRRAGIRVVMITGDHPLTAEAISRQIGLITSPQEDTQIILNGADLNGMNNLKSLVIHGETIEEFDEKDWDKLVLAGEIVFARTQPKHKLEIVKQFQEYGHVVAAVGDGANDSPALKIADLGISMNKTASDVSKEAADMILLDDNFNTIISGIVEGRLIFENLKKSIRYTLTHIFPEVSSLATVAIVGLAFPLPALLILVFDVFCEIGPAMSFATEPAPMDFMKLKPRKIPRMKRKVEQSNNSKSKSYYVIWERIKGLYRIKIEGQSLFDRELIFWTFFQGGIFLAIGAFSAYLLTMIWQGVPLSALWRSVNKYFESSIGVVVEPLTLTSGVTIGASAQSLILQQAQSAFFLSLVIGQWFNLFLTKHRYRYPHGWDLFRNPSTYLGILTSATISCSVVFIPGLQAAFNTATIVAVAIAPPFATGILLTLYEYPRRWIYFRMKKINYNRER